MNPSKGMDFQLKAKEVEHVARRLIRVIFLYY